MTVLEIILVIALLGLLLSQLIRAVSRKFSLGLFVAGTVALSASILLGEFRWQMAPVYLVFVVSSLLLLKRSYSHAAIRFIGATLGLLMLSLGVVLSAGMPIVSLPEPNGPNAVGSTSFTLIDESRDDRVFGLPGASRELYVQIWYPGDFDESERRLRARTLWEELYKNERDLMATLAGYMRNIRTHSFENIPLSSASEPFPLIVFTHGMLSIAEQNTLLMEHLASHGFVVLAVGHTHMSARVNLSGDNAVSLDFARYNSIVSKRTGPSSDVILRQAEEVSDDEERAALWLEYFANSDGLNSLMAIWVQDLRFVLDSALEPRANGSSFDRFRDHIDGTRIGVLGMSFGGGAVAEFCRADMRCRAGLNLDGFANYGTRQLQPLHIPYLALVSPENELSRMVLQDSDSTYYGITVDGATHASFTDLSLTVPLVRWLGFSRIRGERMIQVMNAVSLSFFDAYLREGPVPEFNSETYPDLSVTVAR